MNASDFIAKWRRNTLTEKSAAQQHFLDLCELVGHPKPAEVDQTGHSFTFEKHVTRRSDTFGKGFADVWKKDFFGWEYKGRHHDLDAAYRQLLEYREDLGNPPLLVVSDMDRIIIRTNFTNTPTVKYEMALEELADPECLEKLRCVFHAPEQLHPTKVTERITTEAASHIGDIAQRLRDRGLDPHDVAHYLDRIVFCLFAEDIQLLPEKLFGRLIEKTRDEPLRFSRLVGQLFDVMATGGDFGVDTIRHFNGGLFRAGPVLELTEEEIADIHEAEKLDWSVVDPSIFGTLFERGMDPDKRSQLGAHYTSREDIETLVEPVVMWPLRREWGEVRETVNNLLTTGRKSGVAQPPSAVPPRRGDVNALTTEEGSQPGAAAPHTALTTEQGAQPGAAVLHKRKLTPAQYRKAKREAERILRRFLETRLGHVTVLDPACGSGNFLYVTLQKLKDLEKEVIGFAGSLDLTGFLPVVSPLQLYGIEKNPYAFELAQMTVWIGYIQWTRANGFGYPPSPILRPMKKNFLNIDAILDLTDPDHPREPDWPKVDFIVGNPPFLGGNRVRGELGDAYVSGLFDVYRERLQPFSDLCCYWFERARTEIERHHCGSAGLLATQSIRGGVNREVLQRVAATTSIFFAESDRPWVLDGASVHVAMVGFGARFGAEHVLDGRHVARINANLTDGLDVTTTTSLAANADVSFQGPSPKGPFEFSECIALPLLEAYSLHGRPCSDVVRPVVSATDITKRNRCLWTVDFKVMEMGEASTYEAPFELLKKAVYPIRSANRRKSYAERWWQYAEARPRMREHITGLARFICTPCHSKHRLFAWLGSESLSNQATIIFARSDDYFFGVLHSRLHEVWALRLGTRLETRPRYTPTTCFETFPFPWAPGSEDQQCDAVRAIAEAASELNDLRERWLNPPEWTREEVLEFPGSVDGPWARYIDPSTVHGSGVAQPPSAVNAGVAQPPSAVNAGVAQPPSAANAGVAQPPSAVNAGVAQPPSAVNAGVAQPPSAVSPRSGDEDGLTRDEGPQPGAAVPHTEEGALPAAAVPHRPHGIGTVRYPRLVPRDAEAERRLKQRTLTNLYNQRPTWLDLVHKRLDAAVFAAYGWPPDLSDEQILERLLALNLERAGQQGG